MAKALSMSVLFQEQYYQDVISALDNKDEKAFITCTKNILDSDDQKWLWNYLKHHDKDLAMASDKKWIGPAYMAHW